MTGSKGGADKGVAEKDGASKGPDVGKGDPPTPAKSIRASKPPQEKNANPDTEATTS